MWWTGSAHVTCDRVIDRGDVAVFVRALAIVRPPPTSLRPTTMIGQAAVRAIRHKGVTTHARTNAARYLTSGTTLGLRPTNQLHTHCGARSSTVFPAMSSTTTTPILTMHKRFNSQTAAAPMWDAPTVSYKTVKKMSEQPSPVRTACFVITLARS